MIITGALTGAGVSGATFTGIATFYNSTGIQPARAELVWSFTLTTALSKISPTLGQLASAQPTISGNNSGLTLTFYVEGLQVSPQLSQSQLCSQAALLADAQAQAKAVASAAGVSAGAILSMAEGAALVPTAVQLVPGWQTVSGIVTGGVVTSGLGYASLVAPPLLPTPQPTCTLTVQFQLV